MTPDDQIASIIEHHWPKQAAEVLHAIRDGNNHTCVALQIAKWGFQQCTDEQTQLAHLLCWYASYCGDVETSKVD